MKPIRVQIDGVSDVSDGETRNDGVAGSLTTITSLATGTVHNIRLISLSPEDETVPTLTSLGGTPPSWSFTPSPSDGASYRFELIVDDVTSSTFVHRISTSKGLFFPVFGELAHSGTSIYNSGSTNQISASDDTYNDNPWGYSRIWSQNIQALNSILSTVNFNYSRVSGTYNILTTDKVIGVLTSGEPAYLLLPSASAYPTGSVIFVKDEDSNSSLQNIFVYPVTGNLIDSSSLPVTMSNNGAGLSLYSNGDIGWLII